MNIGSTLKKIREEQGLSQEQFAEVFHVTRQTVSNWENNKHYPDLEMLVRISETYDVPVDTLLREDREFVRRKDRDVRRSGLRKKIILLLAAGIVLLMAVIILLWHPWRREKTRIDVTAEENMSLIRGNEHCYSDDRQEIAAVAETISGDYTLLHERIADPEDAAFAVQFWNDPEGYWLEIVILDSTHIVFEGWECKKTDGPIDLGQLQEIMDSWPR